MYFALLPARKLLRFSKESVLKSSLKHLKPSDKVRHSIMAVVLSKITSSSILKSSTFALQAIPGFATRMFGLQILAMLPGVWLARWVARMDIENFIDQEGYRVRIYNQYLKKRTPIFSNLFPGHYDNHSQPTNDQFCRHRLWGHGHSTFMYNHQLSLPTLLGTSHVNLLCNPPHLLFPRYHVP